MMMHSERRRLWEARIADYSTSGLSMEEWCAQQGVTRQQMRYWLERSRKNAGKVEWTTVEIVEQETLEREGMTVYVGPARIEVRPGFDQSLLTDVLRVVVAAC
jgi:hypothetical protein